MPTATVGQLPTTAEVLASNESKQLYRTNLLRLQIDELLANITPCYEKLGKVDKLVAHVCSAVRLLKPKTIPADCKYLGLESRSSMLSPMEFVKPSSVEVIGSYRSRSIVKPLQNIDISMKMPSSCFLEKDFKSYRYADRRLAYCGEVVAQLKEALESFEVSVKFWHSDKNRAIVSISVPNSVWRILLIPCLDEGVFPVSKLSPDYKNLNNSTECDPVYNGGILADMQQHSLSVGGACAAIQLIKVWLFRRNLLVTFDQPCGVSGFQISRLVAKISPPRETSAFHIFKLFVSYISVLTNLTNNDDLWEMPQYIKAELVWAAKLTLVDDFEDMFCQQSKNSRDFGFQLAAGETAQKIAQEVFSVLTVGLADRVSNLKIRWSLVSGISVSGNLQALDESVTRGPSADSLAAVEFKQFWGPKSELRRFRDGSILECLVWEKGNVVEQILVYLLAFIFPQLKVKNMYVAPLGEIVGKNTSFGVSLWSGLEELRTKLDAISLPITIVDLRASHPLFTSTHYCTSSPFLDCVVEFESSLAWPQNAEALWHTKCALLLSIKSGLSFFAEISANYPQEPFLDVKVSHNMYRLRIHKAVANNVVASPVVASEINRESQLWFEPTLRARIHAMSIENPGLPGAIVAGKRWLDNHLLLEPWLGNWVECTIAHIVRNSSSHSIVMDWLYFLANHVWQTTPVYVKWNNDAIAEPHTECVQTGRWWVSSSIDPECVYLRCPNEWEAVCIQNLAKKALANASLGNWEAIKFHTNNAKVYDVILQTSVCAEELAKALSEQFRKYFSIHYSKRHGIIGIMCEPAAFAPQGNAATKSASMLTVVDQLAIPDFAALSTKLAQIVEGSVKSIKFRK